MKLRKDVHSIGYCEPVQAGSNTPLEKFKVGSWERCATSKQWLGSLLPRAEVWILRRKASGTCFPDYDARISSPRGHGGKEPATAFGHCWPTPRDSAGSQYKWGLCIWEQKPTWGNAGGQGRSEDPTECLLCALQVNFTLCVPSQQSGCPFHTCLLMAPGA